MMLVMLDGSSVSSGTVFMLQCLFSGGPNATAVLAAVTHLNVSRITESGWAYSC